LYVSFFSLFLPFVGTFALAALLFSPFRP
jgi:hypothetical protein